MSNSLDFWRRNWQPFADFNDIQSPFDKMWRGAPLTHGMGKEAWLTPQCEAHETPEAYHFKVDIPGMSKDQIKVDLHDNVLTISGERREERKEDSKKCHFSEISYGSFIRSFTLPAAVDNESVSATYENGTLNVELKKSEKTKSRQISVK
jgi:HSP20 family protein